MVQLGCIMAADSEEMELFIRVYVLFCGWNFRRFYRVLKGKSKFLEILGRYRGRTSLSLIRPISYESRIKSLVSLNEVIFVKTPTM